MQVDRKPRQGRHRVYNGRHRPQSRKAPAIIANDIPELLSNLRIRRPRFSLFTLLLVMTVVALTITVILLWREVGPLRAENKRLNEERGTLMLRDRSTFQAIRIPSRFTGEGRESYRVFVPEDSLY